MPRVIITIPEQDAQPYRFQLERKVVSLGRGSDNDIVVECGSVSGKHAEMHRVDGGYVLTDLGSTNGVKVDGMRQQKVSLASGMTVKLGDVLFEFSLAEEELAILNQEKPVEQTPVGEEPGAEISEETDEDLPKPKREPARQAQRSIVVPESADKGSGFGMIFLFIILAVAAFYAGISIRHQKETGESLLKAIVNKGELQKKAPVDEEPAAEDTTDEDTTE